MKQELKQVGWTKGLELARRRDGREFDCATWLHKARVLTKEEFRRQVEKELTGKDSEPAEIVYFKLYKSQIPVVEHAMETPSRMLGERQIERLLSGDDLRGFPGRCELGRRQSGSAPIFPTSIF